MFLRYRRASILLAVLACVIFVSLLVPAPAQAISSISATVIVMIDNSSHSGAPACTYLGASFHLAGNADNDDHSGRDEIGIVVSDGNGDIVMHARTYVDVGPFDYATSMLPTQAGNARPLTFRFYDSPPESGSTGDSLNDILSSQLLEEVVVDPADYVPACGDLPYVAATLPTEATPSDPVTRAELAHGITREFDNGLVVAKQPDGDLHYYTPSGGCLIARTPSESIENANLADRYIVHSAAGCDGYRIELWSLGYSACQLQLNMYLPNGDERVHQFERQPNASSCIPPSVPAGTLMPLFTTEVRNGPSIDYAVIDEIRAGQSFRLKGKNGNSLWLQIEYNGMNDAWVCRENIRVDGADVFVLPVTDHSMSDCTGGRTYHSSPPGPYTEYLVESCNVDAQLHEFYSDPANQVSLLLPHAAPIALLDSLVVALEAVGVGLDIVNSQIDPPPDEVKYNLYNTSEGYMFEVVRSREGDVISTHRSLLGPNYTQVCPCPETGCKA